MKNPKNNNPYGAGYRAGLCGSQSAVNPCIGFFARNAWDNGWHKGMIIRLTGKR